MHNIGFTCGAFDLTHAGHYEMFKECKQGCNKLVVGLHTDPSIDRKDKHRPVQSTYERYLQLKACKYIDEIIPYDTEQDLYNLLNILRPNVRFIGEDWKDKPYTGFRLDFIKVVFNKRTHEFSSSDLRERVYKAEHELRNPPVSSM